MKNNLSFDIYDVNTPCYVVDEKLLIKNLEILKSVKDKTNCKILLAQKAFSMYETYDLIAKYLDGTTASGINEAMLGREYMGEREVHVYSPAYKKSDIDKLVKICDHIVFNNTDEWKKFRDTVRNSDKYIECGIRVNPGYSEIETDIYNPCISTSRLGVTYENFDESVLDEIDGIHFHAMCEQNSDVLERIFYKFEEKFGKYLYKVKWVNFGGGHHITRDDYDIEKLVNIINYTKEKYNAQVYLEPGEAVALNAGFLVSEVITTFKNDADIAIIDASAACHMPDVLEMPYRPNIIGAGKPNEKKYTYILGASTCLAGDVCGTYSFDEALKSGDRLVFCDMAIYTMCKNNTFNGMNLPDIYLYDKDNNLRLIKSFGYEDFKARL